MHNQQFLVVDICAENAENSSACALAIGEFSEIGMTNFNFIEFLHCNGGEGKQDKIGASHLVGKAPLFENVEQDLFLQLHGKIVCFRSAEVYLNLRKLYANYDYAVPVFQSINLKHLVEKLYPARAHKLEMVECWPVYQGRKTTKNIMKERVGKMGQFVIEVLEDTGNNLEAIVSE